MSLQQFEIRNRWTGNVQVTATIDCDDDAPFSVKLGLAVRWAIKAGVDLRGADLSGADLRDADLRGAYLRGAYLRGADLRDAYLRGAYLRGAYLTDADLRGAYLAGAYLRGAYLTDADLTGADLRGAYLRGAYLTDADLTGADLTGANLAGANLTGANLTGANLRGLPVIPDIDAAILAAIESGGALKMNKWHTCQTTHCRAGWAIHLAGDAGRAIELKYGPAAAGALIYAASRPGKLIPNFYADDDAALADIRACAGEQTGASA